MHSTNTTQFRIALVLQALPIPGAALLIVTGLSASLCFIADLPCRPPWDGDWVFFLVFVFEYAIPIQWPLLVAVLGQVVWGLGYIILPGQGRAFGKAFGTAVLTNGLALVSLHWLMTVALMVGTGISDRRLIIVGDTVIHVGWIGWGLLNLSAAVVICRRTQRLTASGRDRDG